jgi:hypothetical protein
VRLLLPTIGEWSISAVIDFQITGAGGGPALGQLFVNDSGTEETGYVVKSATAVDRATVSAEWKVTTTAADTPIELKVKKSGAGGTINAVTQHTALKAQIGAGGGSTVETVDHGTLTGRGDDDHSQYILAVGTRAFTGEQSMGNYKLTDVLDPTDPQDAATKTYSDSYTDATHGGDVDAHHAETHDYASHTGTPTGHDEAHTIASHTDTTATGAQLNTVTDGSEVDVLHTHRLTTYITIGSETGDGISYTV